MYFKEVENFQLSLFILTQQPDSNGNPRTPAAEPSSTTRLFVALEEELRQAKAEAAGTATTTNNSSGSGSSSATNTSDAWHISINQFIATALTCECVVKAFQTRTEIVEQIEQLQKKRRKCLSTNYNY